MKLLARSLIGLLLVLCIPSEAHSSNSRNYSGEPTTKELMDFYEKFWKHEYKASASTYMTLDMNTKIKVKNKYKELNGTYPDISNTNVINTQQTDKNVTNRNSTSDSSRESESSDTKEKNKKFPTLGTKNDIDTGGNVRIDRSNSSDSSSEHDKYDISSHLSHDQWVTGANNILKNGRFCNGSEHEFEGHLINNTGKSYFTDKNGHLFQTVQEFQNLLMNVHLLNCHDSQTKLVCTSPIADSPVSGKDENGSNARYFEVIFDRTHQCAFDAYPTHGRGLDR